jgi:hypothetical protein
MKRQLSKREKAEQAEYMRLAMSLLESMVTKGTVEVDFHEPTLKDAIKEKVVKIFGRK